MAHLSPRPARGAGLFVRLVYWVVRRRFGRVPIPFGIMAHQPRVLAAVAAYELASPKSKALPERLEDLANIKVATLIGCRFCIDIGASLARTRGLTEDDLRDLVGHETSPRFSELERRVLDYAVVMTQCPMEVPRPLFDALLPELGVEGMVELSAVIAWENYRARFNHAFGAKEEGFSAASVCLLPPESGIV